MLLPPDSATRRRAWLLLLALLTLLLGLWFSPHATSVARRYLLFWLVALLRVA
ncbi:hypothetical protein [Hymenobacter amundsenii]|uniref:hypothetical protein n=1 Tax=Hymenobacter amundsenii TaxID=2006685 RepID=UPI0013FDCF71|nr:hypothetical protein [Hymenobacter amundsenii]